MIANFEYKNPVQIIFGDDRIAELANYLAPNKKILLVYGQGSIKRNGVYERVLEATKDFELVEFEGVEANPVYETLMKAVALGRKEKVEFILAVGGGSVVDASKFIAAAIPFEGDCWTILSDGAKIEKAIPLCAILTLPATGSEMNSGAVISRKATKEKLFFGTPLCYPVFSIMDASTLESLPQRQRANGVIDAFVHTTEQYMTYPVNAKLHDRIAEGILKTLIEEGPKYVHESFDKEVASNIMFTAMMALNGWLSTGVPTDWSIHMVGHELTAMHGVDHGRSLAVVLPSMYRKMLPEKLDKLAQYAERVWDIEEGSPEEKASKAIEKTEAFFNSLGVETKVSAYASDKEATIAFVVDRFVERGWKGLGEKAKVSPEVVGEVLEMAW
jgi:NADP-dependent alcohol dehydrogenase